MKDCKKTFYIIGIVVAILGVAAAVAYFVTRYVNFLKDEEEYEELFDDCCGCDCIDDCCDCDCGCQDAPVEEAPAAE